MEQAEKNSDVASVRAVDRALQILKAFRADDPELSAADLIKRVNLSRPTIYRLLSTLESNGFVVSKGEPQKFRLGPAAGHLAHVWSAGLNLATVAQPMLRRLHEQTGETVSLLVPQGVMRLCIAEIPSAHPLSFRRGVGYQERLVLGASGRVILAHSDMTKAALDFYAAGCSVDLAHYPAELAKVRAAGYAVSRHELIEGAVAVAAPFFTSANLVGGSLAVFGPSVRMKEVQVAKIVKILIHESKALSAALGSAVPADLI